MSAGAVKNGDPVSTTAKYRNCSATRTETARQPAMGNHRRGSTTSSSPSPEGGNKTGSQRAVCKIPPRKAGRDTQIVDKLKAVQRI
eukprot:scaffold8306_cov171-Amphora_coffeaeformis.AAC.13